MGGLFEGSECAEDLRTWTRWGQRTGWARSESVCRNGCERGLQAKPASMGRAQIESHLIEARGRRRLPGRRTVARAVNTACASPSHGSSAGGVCASKGTHGSVSAAPVGSGESPVLAGVPQRPAAHSGKREGSSQVGNRDPICTG